MKKFLLFILFTILIAENIQQPTTLREIEKIKQMTEAQMPINNFINVKDKVDSAQNSYAKAKEAQLKKQEELKKYL